MAWYNNTQMKLDDDVAKEAIERYRNGRTASAVNPRSYLVPVRPGVDVPEGAVGMRASRALIVIGESECERLIYSYVDKKKVDIAGTYVMASNVEWK